MGLGKALVLLSSLAGAQSAELPENPFAELRDLSARENKESAVDSQAAQHLKEYVTSRNLTIAGTSAENPRLNQAIDIDDDLDPAGAAARRTPSITASPKITPTKDPDESPVPTPFIRRSYSPPASGPLFPAFEDDRPYGANTTDAFFVPAWLPTPKRRTIPNNRDSTCMLTNMVNCKIDFDACLLQDPTDVDNVICPCYASYSLCFRQAGCYEMFPQIEVDTCLNTYFCSKPDCMGGGSLGPTMIDGAGAAAVGAAAAAVAVAAAAFLVAWP